MAAPRFRRWGPVSVSLLKAINFIIKFHKGIIRFVPLTIYGLDWISGRNFGH